MTDSLFPDIVFPTVPHPEREPGLSADRRRTLRQRAAVERGVHPLTGGPLAADPDARCGNCRFRQLLSWHTRSYPKCTADDGAWMAHSAASDVRAWWPGCLGHEWGDPELSPDAARSGPQREVARG